jgi:hypothetical protein
MSNLAGTLGSFMLGTTPGTSPVEELLHAPSLTEDEKDGIGHWA